MTSRYRGVGAVLMYKVMRQTPPIAEDEKSITFFSHGVGGQGNVDDGAAAPEAERATFRVHFSVRALVCETLLHLRVRYGY